MGWDQFMPFVITITAIVLTDLLKGVMIGMIAGVFYILRSNFRSSIFTIEDKGNYLIRLRKDISFFSKPKLKAALENLPAGSNVIIDLTKAEFIDKDIIDTINDFLLHAKQKQINATVNRSIYNAAHNKVDKDVEVFDDTAH